MAEPNCRIATRYSIRFTTCLVPVQVFVESDASMLLVVFFSYTLSMSAASFFISSLTSNVRLHARVAASNRRTRIVGRANRALNPTHDLISFTVLMGDMRALHVAGTVGSYVLDLHLSCRSDNCRCWR